MSKETYKEMIVQSTAAKRMIGTVSPIYEDSYVGSWLFEDIGREWDRLWKIIDEMPDQLFPQTASWLLDLWEERYGITPNIGDDYETRRSRVMEAEVPPQPFTPFTLNRWVYANSRRQVIVDEHTGPYTFSVYVVNQPDSLPLDFSKLWKYIVKHKHSHMSFELLLEADSKIKIGVETMYWRFGRLLCGEAPYRNYGSGFDRSKVTIGSHGEGTQFHYPMAGVGETGTIPQTNITSDIERTVLTANSSGEGHNYGYVPCGVINAGGGIL